MSYSLFLALFLGVPLAALLWRAGPPGPRGWWALAITALIAVVYTAPWDNLLVRLGVWSFDPREVVGVVLGVVPLEEYLFYILQVALTGLFTLWLLRRTRLGRR